MKVTYEMEIDSPREIVWTYLDDSEKLKSWMKGVVDDVPTSEGPTRVGSTFRMSIQEGRKVVDYDGEVLVYDFNERMKISMVGGCIGGGMTMYVDYVLTPTTGARTHLAYECTVEVGGIWKILGVVFQPLVKMQLRGFMRKLKELAEAEAGPDPLPA